MNPNQSKGGSLVHQTVAEKIQFQSAGQSIQIEFTDQQLSPHAGTATFWTFLHESGWRELVARCLPHPAPTSNNALSPLTKVLSFVQGLLCGAKKLTHCAYLRRDPMMPALLGIKRVPSQSTFTRFFQGFTGAGKNLACFRPLFAWAMQRLPGKPAGYALDLDSTRLLHEDGHQAGVAVGYTRVGTKPCLHPLFAIFSEVRLVAAFWLRPGNCSCANNVVGFFLDLWDNLPAQLRVQFIVVARLTQPVQSLLRRETRWLATGLDGTEVAQLEYHDADVPATARFIAIRHRIKDKRSRAGGKLLIDCPGYLYQVLVTNLPLSVSPMEVWRDYNGRAACENVIKELDAGYGLPELVCQDFWATEAALSFGVLAHNLIVLFERKLGWLEAVTLGTLRYWLFVTAGIISRPQGQTTIKLAVPVHERDWWRGLWEKLLSPNPNCHAVGTRPSFA